MAKVCKYTHAANLFEAKDYDGAKAIFSELKGYGESDGFLIECDYQKAKELFEAKQYDAAKAIFSELNGYAESGNYLAECDYQQATGLLEAGSYEDAIAIFETIADYSDSAEKIRVAKKELMFQNYGDVIELMTKGVWFYNGGSNAAVNRITFTDDVATIVQIYSDGNGQHTAGTNDVSYIVDGESITLTLTDGSEHIIAYAVDNGAIKLGNGDYLTPAEIEEDLQGYWGLRKSDSVLGMRTNNEYIYYFNNGKLIMESAAEAYGGRNGEYYYYGPHEGTYTVDEKGLHANIRNNWQFGLGIINGEAVMVRCGDVCSRVNGFKGKNGYSF